MIKAIPQHRMLDEGVLALLLGQLTLMRPENGARVLYDGAPPRRAAPRAPPRHAAARP